MIRFLVLAIAIALPGGHALAGGCASSCFKAQAVQVQAVHVPVVQHVQHVAQVQMPVVQQVHVAQVHVPLQVHVQHVQAFAHVQQVQQVQAFAHVQQVQPVCAVQAVKVRAARPARARLFSRSRSVTRSRAVTVTR